MDLSLWWWLLLVLLLAPVLILVSVLVLLPTCTISLALITIIRTNCFPTPTSLSSREQTCKAEDDGQHQQQNEKTNNSVGPWSNISTSIFQGRVFHVRQRPKIHSFQYPLTFAVVDLDEACDLFGNHAVAAADDCCRSSANNNSDSNEIEDAYNRGKLWPLSTLMLLRDEDHLKNGEGLPTTTPSSTATTQATTMKNLSMKERIINLLHERTNGKLNLKQQPPRKILLVTHLMYFGYCFNPVSFFFILNHHQDDIEAVVLEVSNTPWNEMSIYVLHPRSVDTLFSQVYPSESSKSLVKDGTMKKSSTHHYQFEKKFHVSPFMTMDHDYDWKFQLDGDRIVAQAQMYKHADEKDDGDNNEEEEEKKKDGGSDDDSEKKKGILYFTAGFDIRRTITKSTTTQSSCYYPLQLSKIILRYPIYCFVIQIWIHYEALKLLLKGIQFIPHPGGSETSVSKAIAVVMGPVFMGMDMVNDWFVRLKGGGGGVEKTTKKLD